MTPCPPDARHEQMEQWLRASRLYTVLKTIREVKSHQLWLTAGAIRNLVFTQRFNLPAPLPVRDYDIIFYDATGTAAQEKALEHQLQLALPECPVELRNQAGIGHWHRKHLKPAASLDAALENFLLTANCIAVRLDGHDRLHWKTPHGIDDLWAGILRSTPHSTEQEAASKRSAKLKQLCPRLWDLSQIGSCDGARPSDAFARVMTYNILHPELALKWGLWEGHESGDTKQGNWEQRRLQLAANIAAADPDILFLQEVAPGFVPPLPARLALSEICLHDPSKQGIYYGNAIACDKAQFGMSTGKVSLDLLQKRAACHGLLWNREQKFAIQVLSTHLAGYDPLESDLAELATQAGAGNSELERQLAYLDELTGQRLDIVAGDFNMDPRQHDTRSRIAANFGYLATNARQITEPMTGREIDFIYTKTFGASAAGLQAREVQLRWPYPRASDHLPRVVDLRL